MRWFWDFLLFSCLFIFAFGAVKGQFPATSIDTAEPPKPRPTPHLVLVQNNKEPNVARPHFGFSKGQ